MKPQLDLKKLRLEAAPPDPRGQYPKIAWSRPSYALIVSVGGVGLVLEHEGAHISHEMSELGPSTEELQLEPPDDGIWIWTGCFRVISYDSGDYGYEYDVTPEGTFRRATADELQKLTAGESLFEPFALNPDFCERLATAVEADDKGEIAACCRIIAQQDLTRVEACALVTWACRWKTSSESLSRFDRLWAKAMQCR